ncbi:M3 family oligoendopeptidase [Bradyrhizobium sp. U87765 SZCCT0131]|uniref:M3 family oligoendopeptidase n=1 Tax=unclassified Bradyrhizobium TaxID=2631580 RepID=UPI001BAA6ED8|nr:MULTISPECIES: M3 family oligoendopeptidase [unclassified Bradyrhizobium]MBR1221933.1 M3 family oligoendopeptidase [Bradyrhizobium sp. U87765 SZCCT0131]MBR1263869.1 M3 family oligoendopeptidase [Bradyrhizobium sp. U87765 SZCCT0134]MBR1302561.1 M3 family oligoendopeptidase [Bradyrhizobium sp. U87765 SZCCT0110]MBR1320119.1 M3 family oligoendopeptidase [Bradyrhizobium sp. U87765 SZCCT0109]MBR1348768.1 M3 family oligoendopeptidase [Bradyrhizobium sp. U87765 SZCCT0048]
MPAKPATRRAAKPTAKPAAKSAKAVKTAPKAAVKPARKAAAKSAQGRLPEWNLADLYPSIDAPEIARDLDKLEADCIGFETAYKGKLAEGVAAANGGVWLAEAVRSFEAIDDLAGRLVSFAGLVHAGDTVDPAISKFYGDVSERITAASVHLLFFTLELNRIDDALLEQAMETPELGHYRPWLEDIRKDKPYQLEDRVEQLFHEKSVSGYAAWNRLFDQTIAGLRFRIAGKDLAIEPTLSLMQDRAPDKRKAAAQALAKTFKANERTFALITNTLAKDKEISDRWRGFGDIADSRHLSNRVEREVVDALVASVRAAYPRISHRYYALKARWFGKKQLPFWDRNAPLPFAATGTIAWPEARKMVLGAYGAFSPQMADIASRFFDERWIDAPVRPGKAPGAFSHPTTPSAHPYVLLNYQGKPRDVMVLAHELGHGVHQVLAAKNGALMAPTPLTLAETASVFGEMLTFKRLLASTKAGKQRQALLAGKVEDMINTVVRQIAFYTFERAVHTERRNGELTAQRLGELWLSVQGESLGPAIEIKPGYETYWMYIPHFIHSPFYVYAYAFGDCLVNSLYAVYERAAEGFAERYLAMLAAGGTRHYSELLKPFGLDAKDPTFWDGGLSVIEGMISELEAMG